MAIAFDNSTASSSASYSHTCTGSNLILWVHVGSFTATTSSVTYNGVSMTKAVDSGLQDGAYNTLWYLINPATGSNTVAITVSGGSLWGSEAASYTGAKQSGQPDATNSAYQTSAPLAVSVTTVADNCWVVGGGMDKSGSGVSSAGSGTTQRSQSNNSNAIYDNNAAKTPAGSVTLNLADTAGGAHLSWVAASFAPALAATAKATFLLKMI